MTLFGTGALPGSGTATAAAEGLIRDAAAIRRKELLRSRQLRHDPPALVVAEALTQRLVDNLLAPVVAFMLVNDNRPEVIARAREAICLQVSPR